MVNPVLYNNHEAHNKGENLKTKLICPKNTFRRSESDGCLDDLASLLQDHQIVVGKFTHTCSKPRTSHRSLYCIP